jgi:hypothetical protein
MAQNLISPGVFTNEVDQSFLAGGIQQIGAAIVGPTVKGPALVPTQITTYNQFQQIFGTYTDESYLPYVVQNYLANGGNVITVTRLLYEDGYKLTNGALAIIAKSGSTQVVTHVLHPVQAVTTDGATNVFNESVLLDGGSGSFAIRISGSFSAAADSAIGFGGSFLVSQATAISASINSNSNDYVAKRFGRSPKSTDYPAYVQYENPTAYSQFANLGQVTMELFKFPSYEFVQDFQTAATPWITSQKVGAVAKDLIRFHSISQGTAVNYDVKIGIKDVRTSTEVADPNGYGTFTVEVRRVNTTNIPNSVYGLRTDTDLSPAVEAFTNVNLDPNSSRYIARVIGNRYQTVDDDGVLTVYGDYPNQSNYIRVEVTDGVANRTNDKTLIPFGYRALTSTIPMASGSLNLVSASIITSQVSATGFNSNTYFGYDFSNVNNLNYLSVTPTSGSTTGSNADFYFGNVNQDGAAGFPTANAPYSSSLEGALTGSTFATNIALSTRKFIVPMQGGFDGAKPNLKKYSGQYITSANTFGFNCSNATSTGTVAYNKAFSLLSNTDYYDMNLLITPGIIDSLHSSVTSLARLMAENRQDTFYVMDSNALTDNINTVVNQVTTINSNYTATYWPWVRIVNPSTNAPLWVPPSIVVPGVLAFTDRISAPWYAPAGLNRGGLSSVTDTYKRLTQSDRDALYSARVNPIANFPNEGVVIWGQKTLQSTPSALDRVNVRRLLIEVKKFIASSTRYLVFEPNNAATRLRFLSIVNPYLDSVKNRQGLNAFRVIMDDSNNTPDLVDQNILYGQLLLQPTRTAEFIVLDFNIQPTGAAFGG